MSENENEFVYRFEQHLIEDGKSAKTIESYVGDVRAFVEYLASMGAAFDGELKRFYITSYKNHLLENNYEIATINKKINSLQSFNRYLIDLGRMTEQVVDLRKDNIKIAAGSERQVEVFTEKQQERMLFYIQNGKKVSVRNRMIFLLLLYTGVRVSELCDIRLKNIDFLTGHLKVFGKGGKVREIPLKPEVLEAIKDYLVERDKNPYRESEHLILGQRGSIGRDAVNTLLENFAVQEELGIKLKPHTFRHTFCTRLIQKGVPLTTVSKLAGHSCVETTARFYINCSKEDKMKAVCLL